MDASITAHGVEIPQVMAIAFKYENLKTYVTLMIPTDAYNRMNKELSQKWDGYVGKYV